MKRSRRMFAVVAVLALAVVGATAATVSAGGSKSSKPLAGGTYRVGVEAAFGVTDGLDPTGEYAGDYWGVLQNLMVRAMLGTKHLAGGRRQHDRARPRNVDAEGHERWQDVHLHAQEAASSSGRL